MEIESTALASQREKVLKKKEQTDVFSCSSNTSFLEESALTEICPGSNCALHRRIPQPILVFTASRPAMNSCLYLVASSIQLTLPVFYPASTALMAFSFEFLPPVITRCRFAADAFLFLSRMSLIILHLFLCFLHLVPFFSSVSLFIYVHPNFLFDSLSLFLLLYFFFILFSLSNRFSFSVSLPTSLSNKRFYFLKQIFAQIS